MFGLRTNEAWMYITETRVGCLVVSRLQGRRVAERIEGVETRSGTLRHILEGA